MKCKLSVFVHVQGDYPFTVFTIFPSIIQRLPFEQHITTKDLFGTERTKAYRRHIPPVLPVPDTWVSSVRHPYRYREYRYRIEHTLGLFLLVEIKHTQCAVLWLFVIHHTRAVIEFLWSQENRPIPKMLRVLHQKCRTKGQVANAIWRIVLDTRSTRYARQQPRCNKIYT